VPSFPVTDTSGVSQARRGAAEIAAELGFSEEDVGRAALVATEMCTNMLKHAGQGELLASRAHHGVALELLALDQGPGMDVAKSLRDGYSTAGSLGAGLGAIERLAQEFDVYSPPGRGGAAIFARLWTKGRPRSRNELDVGAVLAPMPGERACGDAWCLREHGGGALVMGVDGLGHGVLAAEAAQAACRVFTDAPPERSLTSIMTDTHVALRSGRGAAVSLVEADWRAGQIRVVGVGNIGVALASAKGVKRIASDNGIVGHATPRFRELSYPCDRDSVLIVHSDGLTSSWRLDAYPGLLTHPASVIAGVLYRDFKRGRDDALVLAIRNTPS
jgi:anti-sigma regulatory factor (Ser/Thr protein kinase)